MNFVFWFVIVLCLMGVWLAVSPLFEEIGSLILKTDEDKENR